MLRGLLVILLAVGVGTGATGEAAKRRKRPRILPPLALVSIVPQAVRAGVATDVVVSATATSGAKRRRRAVLLRVDETGRPRGRLGVLRDDGRAPDASARDGVLTGTARLEEAAPGSVLVQVKGTSRRRPGSELALVLVTNDPQPLGALLPAVELAAPADGGDVVLDDPLATQLDQAIAAVLPGHTGALRLSRATAAAGVTRGATVGVDLGGLAPNTAAADQATKVLDAIGDLGIMVGPLRTTLAKTKIHREGPQAGGTMLDASRGVNGLTIVQNTGFRSAVLPTSAGGTTYHLTADRSSHHVILNGANMDSLLGDPIIDPATGRLGEGASTFVHELVHATAFDLGCFDRNAEDEPFTDAMEEVINDRVATEGRRKNGQDVTADEAAIACKLADIVERNPEARPCMEALGFTVPTGQQVAVTPTFILFTAVQGGPVMPASQTVTVTAPVPICGNAKLGTRQFELEISRRKGGTPFTIDVTATATAFDGTDFVPLPPGNYTSFVEISSPSSPSAVILTVGLRVTAPVATTTTTTTTTTLQTGRAVRLNYPTGTLAAGTEVCLAQVHAACVNPAHPPNCAYAHLHSAAGITIDGVSGGPFPDPQTTSTDPCGYGEVFTKAGCGPDGAPPCS